MKTRDKYLAHAAELLAEHRIQHNEIRGYHGTAYIPQRVISAPAPVDCMGFYVFCHEIAHIVLDHRFGMWLPELEADRWALRQFEGILGWIPHTVRRRVFANDVIIMREAMRRGYIDAMEVFRDREARRA
jgi:hypothetical protein